MSSVAVSLVPALHGVGPDDSVSLVPALHGVGPEDSVSLVLALHGDGPEDRGVGPACLVQVCV